MLNYGGMNYIDDLLSNLYPWSYFIVGIGVMIENAGIPVPGETIMLAAAVLSASGKLDPNLVIISGATGAIIGDNIGYWIGRFGGRKLIEYASKKMPYAGNAVKYTEQFFNKYGGITVFLARFITGIRIFAGPVAGASLMGFKRFFLYNTLGAIVWACTIVFGTMYIGSVYMEYIRDYMDADLVIYGLLFIVLLFITYRVIRRLRGVKKK